MSKKISKSGGKYGGGHTTLIPLAAMLAEAAHASSSVKKIAPGFIKAGLRSANGNRRVKITDDGQSILLHVRDNTSQQEVRIYTDNIGKVREVLTRAAEKKGLTVTYQSPSSTASS